MGYYGANMYVSIEGIASENSSAFQKPIPLLESYRVSRHEVFNFFSDDSK